MSCICDTDVPKVEQNYSTCCLILNIFLPGVGTVAAYYRDSSNKNQILIGILQIIFWFMIVGWIWSIYWGCLIYDKANPDPSKPANVKLTS